MRQLIQLQTLDAAVRGLEVTVQRLARQATEAQDNVREQEKALHVRSQEAQSFRRALDKREVDLKESESKIARLQMQLNSVKTNKEYAALQHEIMGLKADASRIEDEIFSMLERADEEQRQLKELTRRTEEEALAAQQQRQVIERGIKDAEERTTGLRQERAALVEKIPRDYLTRYERLLQKADGRAIAACRHFVCQACRMSVTANTVNRLMASEEIVYCHSCGRILYLAEDEDLSGVAQAGRKDQ